MKFFKHALAAAALLVAVPAAQAQTVKVGLLLTYSGPAASLGDLMDKSINLYIKEHEKELPAGVKLELIRRDETGPNPEYQAPGAGADHARSRASSWRA